MKKLVFSEGDLPVLVEVRRGAERRLYILNRASPSRCGAMLQGVPEQLVRELERGRTAVQKVK